jgi:hypothetical protein
MNVTSGFDHCRAARVPRAGLGALGRLRRSTALRVAEEADCAWVFWEAAMPSVVQALLPVPGVVFYRRTGERWHALGAALPEFAVPKPDGRAVDAVVLPGPLSAQPPPAFRGRRLPVRLVEARSSRPTTAIRCGLDVLCGWVDSATTFEISRLSGAVCDRSVWLRGEQLPPLAGAERFWGNAVLIPLGLRAEPDWPEGPLRWAARVDDDEILVLTADGAEALPTAAFRPLTRAGIRKLASSLRA